MRSRLCLSLLSLALFIPAALAGPVTTGYLFYAGGGVPTAGDANPALDGTLTGDNGVFSVLVANVDITAGTITNWRYATGPSNQLPEDNPNTVGTTEAYSWMFLENAVHVYNGRLYVGPGDWNGDGSRSTADVVAWADIDQNGTLGSWTLSDPIVSDGDDQAICGTAIVEVGGQAYYYVLGGTGSGLTRVAYAAINPTTGALGAWATTTAPLPAGTWFNRAAVSGTTIIHASGNLPADSRISYGTVGPTGDVSSWSDGGIYRAAGPTWDFGMTTAVANSNEFAIIVGGRGPNPSTVQLDEVRTAPVVAGVPGSWTLTNPHPGGPRRHNSSIGLDDLLIDIGGVNGGNTSLATADVYTARVTSTGAVNWNATPTSQMIQPRSFGGVAFFRTAFPAVTGVEAWQLYQ